jgi:hypothetical protein
VLTQSWGTNLIRPHIIVSALLPKIPKNVFDGGRPIGFAELRHVAAISEIHGSGLRSLLSQELEIELDPLNIGPNFRKYFKDFLCVKWGHDSLLDASRISWKQLR